MVLWDQTKQLFIQPLLVESIFTDPDAHNILDGLAVHWYEDDEHQHGANVPPSVLSDAHEVLNGKWILYTEV
uniref:Uncharacterized protein n=1 Tax=Acrobeloides nanus TaxID=290746 RepID=A0A914DME8_9BILA